MGRASESTLESAAPMLAREPKPKACETTVLAGGTVVSLHPARTMQADVLLRGESIAQVGGAMPEGTPRIDVSGCLVAPAFVVAHTHLYMALACGMPPPPTKPQTLTDHLQSIWWTLDKALDDELVHTSALVGAAMAAKAGAACVVDLHSSPRAIDGSLDRVEAALDEVGLRGVLAYETTDREGRGRRDAALHENRRFLEKVRQGRSRHLALVGAHAMMSLADDTLDALRELSDRYEVGMHVHVAEDTTDALDAEKIKKTTLDKRLERLGLARPGSIAAQAVRLGDDLVHSLGEAGAFIATSPRSNMNHGVGLFGGKGDHIALGTDGLDGDVLAEARVYALRHADARDGLDSVVGARVAAGQRLVGHLDGDSVPRMILPGARADIAVLDYQPITPMTASNLAEHLSRNWSNAHVRDTIVGGKLVMRDRKLLNIDERELMLRSRAAAGRLWERMQGYY